MEYSLLWITTSWCQPCKRMSPAIETLKSEGVNVIKMDAEEQPDQAIKWGVTSVPTLILLDGNKEIDRHLGALNINGLKRFCRM